MIRDGKIHATMSSEYIFTRPRPKDGESTVFTGVCPHFEAGGCPHLTAGGREYPHLANEGGGNPICLTGGKYPHLADRGVHPLPDQDWMGVPPHQDCIGVPPNRTGWGIPQPLSGVNEGTPQEIEQQSEHLLRGGWYASCFHAEGLSCWHFVFCF